MLADVVPTRWEGNRHGDAPLGLILRNLGRGVTREVWGELVRGHGLEGPSNGLHASSGGEAYQGVPGEEVRPRPASNAGAARC